MLEDLELEIANCSFCPLHEGRTNPVPGAGNPNADIMFIGEGPGQREDEQGLPFVGRSGNLLIEGLTRVGLNRSDVYITNVVKCRPPNNRDPLPEEAEICKLHYLTRQIEIIRPKLIVTLGRIAASYILERPVRITKERGHLDAFPLDPDILVMIVYHPSYVLRNRPKLEKDFFEDILQAKEIVYGLQNTAAQSFEKGIG